MEITRPYLVLPPRPLLESSRVQRHGLFMPWENGVALLILAHHACWLFDERERAFFFLTSHEQGRVSCHLVVARPPSVRAFLYLNARIRQCWYPSVVGGASLRQSRMAASAAASIQLVRQDRPFSLVVKVEGPKATGIEIVVCVSFFNE